MNSVRARLNVSCISPGGYTAAHDSLIFEVEHPELILGPVEQHPQVVAVDAEGTTNLIFVHFLQENGAKQQPVFLWQIGKNAADLVLGLTGHEPAFEIENLIGFLQVKILEGLGVRTRAVEFQQDVVAYRVDEGSEAVRLTYTTLLAEGGDNATERLLAKLVDCLRGQGAGAQLDPQELFKIGEEVVFGGRMTTAQPLHVRTVESEKLH